MKISIIGTGYVGSVLGAGLARIGHDVVLVDVIPEKVDMINAGKAPIHEKGLQEMITDYKEQISATTNLREAVLSTDLTFICVGTPSRKDGSMDVSYVHGVAREIGNAIREKQEKHYIVIKSTVLPGTAEECIKIIEEASGKRFPQGFSMASNPEFLREGSAVHDFLHQDRIILGTTDPDAVVKLNLVYAGLSPLYLETKFKEAEMIKYANNSFLATKISFINEIGNICKRMGIDTNVVARGIGMDFRIGQHFLKSGIGFGGSCFPKDVSAITHKATVNGYNPRILRAVLDVNKEQPLKVLEVLDKRVGSIKGKKIAVLGLAFKAGTDDVRESPSMQVVKELATEKASLVLFDPIASENFRKIFPLMSYAKSAQEAVNDAEIVLILTEWPEFEKIDYGEKIVIDGKNLLGQGKEHLRPKNYEGVCW